MVPQLETPTITLAEAVRLTLNHNPQILSSKQAVGFAMGRFQESRGLFDGVARVAPGYAYTTNQIRPFILSRENDKRTQLEETARAFAETNLLLNQALQEMVPRLPRCPEGLEFITFSEPFVLDRLDPVEAGITGLDQPLRGTAPGLGGIEVGDVCVPSTADFTLPPDVFVDFWNDIARINDIEIDNIVDEFTQYPREQVALASEISEAVATRAALARERLGESPDTEIRKAFFIEGSYDQPLRNGMTLSGEVRFSSEEQNFKDRILDPVFGGFEFNTPFTSFVSVTLETPLAKGRGRISRQAPERAAELTLEAQQDLLRHSMSTETFRTILAYYNLIAAQDALRLLEESAQRQRRYLELTQQLIDAEDVPRSELDRAQARAATVFAGVSDGQLSVLSARISLAQSIGIALDELTEAPLAASGFPEGIETIEPVETLAQQAIRLRRDLMALASLRDSSRVLSDAARFDLKRRFDLSATFGLSPLYTSPFFRFLPDEANPIETYQAPPPPTDSPVHFYSPTGYWRMLNSEWQPFVAVGITFEVPFANNLAEGQALQAESSYRRSDIERTDLGRVVYQNVIEVGRSVGFAGQALRARLASLDFYRQTLEAAAEQYRTGDITLIDTLTTEEDLTRQSLELVSDLQVYYSLLARLRFEVGRLVTFENEGEPGEAVVFDPTGLVTP
jgi:outer membrane protein TolC